MVVVGVCDARSHGKLAAVPYLELHTPPFPRSTVNLPPWPPGGWSRTAYTGVPPTTPRSVPSGRVWTSWWGHLGGS